MDGGAGSDIYFVDSVSDVVRDSGLSTDGTDLIYTSVSLTNPGVDVSIENITLVGGAITVTGNAADNVITGNELANYLIGMDGNDTLLGGLGDDYLSGESGDDWMDGGAGSDQYVVDSVNDIVKDSGLATDGTDAILSTVSLYALDESIENLYLFSSATDGVGNSRNNYISGTNLDNNLSGGGGNDTLYGLNGNDWLDGGEGNDELYGDGSSDAPTGFSDTLFGGSGDDRLYGSLGDDMLIGGEGKDTLIGGLGDDTYFVESALDDVVTERAGEGDDSVYWTQDATQGAIAYTLANEVESLYMTGGGSFVKTAKGNQGNNIIWGSDGMDNLDGLGGNDLLIGGAGYDEYTFGVGGGQDTIYEQSDDNFFGDYTGEEYEGGHLTLNKFNLDQLRLTQGGESGSDLVINILNSSDQVTIGNFFDASTYQIGITLRNANGAGGYAISADQVNGLVAAMATVGIGNSAPLNTTQLNTVKQYWTAIA